MAAIAFKGYRFPPQVIRQAVTFYFRFTLSLRDMKELLAERGIDVSYETIRCWTMKFGRAVVADVCPARPEVASAWGLDEMGVHIRGRPAHLWRAVDSEGEVLDMIVQHRRDELLALTLLTKFIKDQDTIPYRKTDRVAIMPVDRPAPALSRL